MLRRVVAVMTPRSGTCAPTLPQEPDAASKTTLAADMDVCSDAAGYSLAKRSDSEGGHVCDCSCTGERRAGQVHFCMISERTVDLYLCSFALGSVMFAVGHCGMLFTDSRFVFRPDEAMPHEAEALRIVRVMDVVVLIMVVGVMLSSRRQPLEQIAETGIRGNVWMGVIYLIMSAVDYSQCHFHAGGIGSKCHGRSCLIVATAHFCSATIFHFLRRYIFVLILCLQGLYRLHWASNLDQPPLQRAIAGGGAWQLILVSFGCCLYEVCRAPRETGQRSKEDLEQNLKEEHSCDRRETFMRVLEEVINVEVNHEPESGPGEGRTKDDDVRVGGAVAGSVDTASLCKEATAADVPSRVREDDARAGAPSWPVSVYPAKSRNSDGQVEAEVANVEMAAEADMADVNFGLVNVDPGAPLASKSNRPRNKEKDSERKRKNRLDQNELVLKLDALLPEWARRFCFKGAGSRSAGVRGRSLFSVLSDTIRSIRVLKANEEHSTPIANIKTFSELGVTMEDVLMSARNTLVMEVLVHNESGELMVRALGAGARDWFKDAPWHVGEGCFVRDLVDVDDVKVVDQLREAISKGTKLPSFGAATPSLMQVSLSLAHFSKTKCLSEGMQADSKQTAFEHECDIELVEYVASRVEVHLLPADTKAPGKESSSLRPMHNQNGSRALLYFFLPSTWECIAGKQECHGEGGHVGSEDEAGGSEAAYAQAQGSWRCSEEQVDPNVATKAKTIEELIGSAHEYMGVFKLNYLKSSDLSVMCAHLWCGQKSGLEQLMSVIMDPFEMLDERDKDVMKRYLSSFDSPMDSRMDSIISSKSRTQHVGDCIELHSGIRTSPEGDFLAVFYRLALPRNAGGYESAWKMLYTYKLNKQQTDLKVGPGMSLKLLPRLVRGQKSQVGVVILALNIEDRADKSSVKLLQQIHLNKNAKGRGASLEGQVCYESKLFRFNLCLDKVEQGNKGLLENVADTRKDVAKILTVGTFLQDGVLNVDCDNHWGESFEQLNPDEVRNIVDEAEYEDEDGSCMETNSICYLSTTGDSSLMPNLT